MRDVVDQVPTDHDAAVGVGEGSVDSPAVHRHLLHVMQVVVLDDVVPGELERGFVPGDNNARVGCVMHQVVADKDLLGRANENPDGAEVVQPAVVDVVVGDAVLLVVVRGHGISPFPGVAVKDRARGDSAAAQVMDVIPLDHVLRSRLRGSSRCRPHAPRRRP